jgi:hypothetical protein
VSEYQYYEFQAIDKPLDDNARSALRAITSRATITRTSLVNEYHFGDFKGNPHKLMEKYFDAHLYFANWGTRRLMLRLPLRLFDPKAAEPYRLDYALEVTTTKEHIIFEFFSDLEGDEDWYYEGGEDYDYDYDEDEEVVGGKLSPLVPIRNELAAGDLRALYIGWLAGIFAEDDQDQVEPVVPPGLGKLTDAQKTLAEYLRVGEALVEGAAETSSKNAPTGPTDAEFASWVVKLPAAEKDRYLTRLIQGDSATLTSELQQEFRAAQPKKPAETTNAKRRTIGELLAARDRLAEENARREKQRKAEAAARREREKAEARAKHLDTLVGREETLWHEVEAAVAKKLPKEYDRALELLLDLRDLAERTNTGGLVIARVKQLREQHATKRGFLQRLDKAGFPKR